MQLKFHKTMKEHSNTDVCFPIKLTRRHWKFHKTMNEQSNVCCKKWWSMREIKTQPGYSRIQLRAPRFRGRPSSCCCDPSQHEQYSNYSCPWCLRCWKYNTALLITLIALTLSHLEIYCMFSYASKYRSFWTCSASLAAHNNTQSMTF